MWPVLKETLSLVTYMNDESLKILYTGVCELVERLDSYHEMGRGTL